MAFSADLESRPDAPGEVFDIDRAFTDLEGGQRLTRLDAVAEPRVDRDSGAEGERLVAPAAAGADRRRDPAEGVGGDAGDEARVVSATISWVRSGRGSRSGSGSPPCATTIRFQDSSAAPEARLASSRERASAASMPRRTMACSESLTLTSRRRGSPPPERTSMAARTSDAVPRAAPRGWFMSVMSASQATPESRATCRSAVASSCASATVSRKAPLPHLTSRTRVAAPRASFFDMIEATMRGSDGTVAVISRRA